jgi:hypothetical protein
MSDKLPTLEELKLMTPEERRALDRKLQRQLIINFAIIFGTKAVILYGIHRWAKSYEKKHLSI